LTDDDSRLGYTIKEYARLLGVHHNSIRREIRRGNLSVSSIGNRLIITAATHLAYMARTAEENRQAMVKKKAASCNAAEV
jgi:IS30 family transposase